MHWMTFEYFGGNFHCGRPWHPYGIAAALPDCASIEGPQGAAAPFQNFLNYGNPVAPHDTTGYPRSPSGRGRTSPTRARTGAGSSGPGWRAAADGDGRQREPRAVRAAGEPSQTLQRDGHGAPRHRGHPAAPGLRRRAGRRTGQGLLPDRHRPVRGAAGDQPGQDGGRARDRDLRAVRTAAAGTTRPATRRRSTASSTRCTSSACARACCSTSSTTRSPACASTAARSAR